MFIKDKNISLRGAEPSDAINIFEWENDLSIWRVSDTYAPYTLYQVEQFLQGNNDLFACRQLRLMIDLNDSDISIGCIDIYDFDPIHQRAGIGILILDAYRKKGYAAQAIQMLIKYLFEYLFLKQVFCLVDEHNNSSLELFTKAGFEICGRKKEWIKTPEGFIDQIEFQYINKNYENGKS